ncbi:hypothetical protein G6F31_016568 [Rhizopus arrhizus]|nr:hypothetical protein G6F31_016568 [Rhizopus arrhizus]
MRGHAHDVSRLAGLQPVQRRQSSGRIVQRQLHAGHQHLLQRHGADVMAHGAEAESDGILGVVPVAHQRPAIGQQRVIAVHHTLGGAGGAGGEGQVGDLVRVAHRRSPHGRQVGGVGERMGPRGQRHVRPRQGVEALEAGYLVRQREDVLLVGIRAIADGGEQGAAVHAPCQLDHFGHGVVLVQRWAINIAAAGAGQEQDDGLGAAGQPGRHPVALPQSGPVQALGHAVDVLEQLAPGQAPMPDR